MAERAHILVVDDEPMILSSLRNLLEFDYTVHTAENGFRALDILKSAPIKVLMSDQRMPEMLGHELLRQAKMVKPNTIRLLLTGYSDLDSIMNSVNTGEIFRYINKPWKSDMLLGVFKLAVRLHDQLNGLTSASSSFSGGGSGTGTASGTLGQQRLPSVVKPQQPQPQTGSSQTGSSQTGSSQTGSSQTGQGAATPSAAQVVQPMKSVHIEVEEKSSSVLFVGYAPKEIEHLTKRTNEKYEVVAVASVDDALREIAKKPISVIISEVRFEEYDGVEFLSTVKQDYPHIVTVILTETIDAELAIRSINELNVFRYLTKPLEQGAFQKVLEDAAAKSSAFKSSPQTNLHHAANLMEPKPASTPAVQESALRLKLRAAQAALQKGKTT